MSVLLTTKFKVNDSRGTPFPIKIKSVTNMCLKLKWKDNNGCKVKIINITLTKPFQKEFKLDNPRVQFFHVICTCKCDPFLV